MSCVDIWCMMCVHVCTMYGYAYGVCVCTMCGCVYGVSVYIYMYIIYIMCGYYMVYGVCACVMCVSCMGMCMVCVHVCKEHSHAIAYVWNSDNNLDCYCWVLSSIVLETGSLCCSPVHNPGWLSHKLSGTLSSVCLPSCQRSTGVTAVTYYTHTQFWLHLCFGASKLDPHACVANSSTTEHHPRPLHPQFYFEGSYFIKLPRQPLTLSVAQVHHELGIPLPKFLWDV